MTLCPLPLYLDHIFMYFYFLGSPTGDSQNGVSGVDFTEHGFLSHRGCSQPIFHGWSKQQPSERGSGDRCSLEDSKIHKKKQKTHRQWSTFILWAAPQLNTRIYKSVFFQWCHLFSHHRAVQPPINVLFCCLTITLCISPSISINYFNFINCFCCG